MGISVFIYDEDKNIKETELQLGNSTKNMSVDFSSAKNETSGELREDQQFFWVEMGDIMLFSSLLFDGLTGAIQGQGYITHIFL